MVLAAFLHKKKYPFTKATNGLLGLQAVMAKSGNFDIILMGAIYRCLVILSVRTFIK